MADGKTSQLPIVERPFIVEGKEFLLEETADFPYDDPWSELTRGVVRDLNEAGAFDGRNFLEAGLGDARNALLALDLGNGGADKLTGIELDDWRLAAASRNLAAVGIAAERVDLHQTDVVEWLTSDTSPIRGWSLACLPQAPREATENDADGYQDLDSLDRYHGVSLGEHDIDTYGLTLNAAYLGALRERAVLGDSEALVILSGRVPRGVLKELFTKTGWAIANVHNTFEPIQQDPDTGIGWTIPFDDGRRFQEKDGEGKFVPITAEEAEARREESLVHGEEAREQLNVYHELSAYHLHPREGRHGTK